MEKPPYSGITVISPMLDKGELKDQDRARWSEPCQAACVCDGVTTSPNSQKAAEIISDFIHVIFNNDPVARLEMLSDILMALRSEIGEPANTAYSAGIQRMLQTVIRQKNSTSYQTTAVAVKLTHSDGAIIAHIFKCGDTGFFAFSEDGGLLSSSLEFSVNAKPGLHPVKKEIPFGPGDEILVRVDGSLSGHPDIARKSGIDKRFTSNWLVCRPVESCVDESCKDESNLLELKRLRLADDDILLIPEFLYGKALTSRGKHFRVLKYSSCIKALSSKVVEITKAGFKDKGNATNVLPDHFYTGGFDLYKDTFPAGTNFLLCSDGFYSSFDDFNQMHKWLVENNANLKDSAATLHANLKDRGGDDDISFIWVRPSIGDEDV
jgi:serine/threonine protein phosphatase PrpC